ncbi:hypothetical protein MHYP_G00100590 [Metynnis hypsauchen]
MANPCFRNTSCDASDLWPQDSVMSLDCGGGLILYYLVPVDGVYKTRHSSCTASSCGLNTSCNPSDGSCSYTNADCINIAGGYHTIKDVCKYHKTLSNVWRNIGCTLNTFKNKDDKYLQEGWYRFTGFGGDRMAYPCINRFDCRVRDERNWLQQSALNLDCGGGLILYYLVPIDGVYMTREYI